MKNTLPGQTNPCPCLLGFAAVFICAALAAGLCSAAQEGGGFTRTEAVYSLPEVTLVRQDGASVSLSRELDDGHPVMVSFIFTSCAVICPMLSHLMSQVQQKLAKGGEKRHMVSISIDPEQDTPARLLEYAKKFRAGSGWQFYTGTAQTSIDVQKAFNAYRGDKDNHAPLIFMRASPGKPWVRIEGFATSDDLLHEYRRMIGQ